jgi:hypothetical protein
MSRLSVSFLALIIVLCLAGGAAASTGKDNEVWKIYYGEAENLLLNARFDEALEKADSAIDKLKSGGDGTDLAQAYYLKSLLILYTRHDTLLLKETLSAAVRAAPAIPIPDKDYFSDPRLDEWRTKVFNEMSEEAKHVVAFAEKLFAADEYCECLEVLESVSWYTEVSVNAKNLQTLARKKCVAPASVQTASEAGLPEETGQAAVDLSKSRKIGVLPICFESGLQDVYGSSESNAWVAALREEFGGYEVEMVNNVDYGQLKARFGVEESRALFEDQAWVIDKMVVDRLKGIKRKIPEARRFIMEQGGYRYLVVAVMTPRGQATSLSKSPVIIRAQIYSPDKTKSPLEEDSRHITADQLKYFPWHFGKLAADLDPN